jgi:phage nucleotide-binding protein
MPNKPSRRAITKPVATVVDDDDELPTSPSSVATEFKDYITMFYGPPGVGKTTFVNGIANGRVLFLSTDRGTRFLNTMRKECTTWADFEKWVTKLEAMENVRDHYDLVCIDHADDMMNMLEDDVCAKLRIEALGDAGYGKGWKAYKQNITRFLQRLMKLNLGIVFICHETIKTVKTRNIELERTMPHLSKSAWNALVPLADIIGYCGFRYVKGDATKGTKGGEIRILQTTPMESLYAKDRTSRNRPANGVEMLDGEKFMATFQ